MPNIDIVISDKKAFQLDDTVIVCGNKGYTVTFQFDSEWDEYAIKTARFIYWANGQALYEDVPFTNNNCAVPALFNTPFVLIGVFAGDLHTSTPAEVKCIPGILDYAPVHHMPPEDVYNKLLEELKKHQNEEEATEKALDSIIAAQNSYLCASFASSAVVDIQYYNGSMEATKGATLVDTGTVVESYISAEEMATKYGAAYSALNIRDTSLTDRQNKQNYLTYHSDVDVGSTFAVELYGVFRPDNCKFFECLSLVSLRRQNNYDYSETDAPIIRIYPYGAVDASGASNTSEIDRAPNVYWGNAQHLLIVGDVDTITLYVNGELVDTVTLEGYAFSENNEIGDFFIGGNYTGSKHYSAGDKMIRFRIFDFAPTADEAASLYASYKRPSLISNKILSVDFSTGSTIDTAQNLTAIGVDEHPVTFVDDALLGEKVAYFDSASALGYDVGAAYMSHDFTVEAYLNVEGPQDGQNWGMVMGTYTNGLSGWGISTGKFTEGIGTGDALSLTTGVSGVSQSSLGCGNLNKWTHLIYTNNGRTESLYLDGKLIGTNTVQSYSYDYNASEVFRLSGFNMDGQFGVFMKASFLNIYNTSVTANEAAALYASMYAPATTIADKIGIIAANEQAVYDQLFRIMKSMKAIRNK